MVFPNTQAWLYRSIFKPIAFRFDPETVHERVTQFGRWMGGHATTREIAHSFWHYAHSSLEQSILGIRFPNPIGLTAGFDKDGLLTEILPEIGFGFAELGSVTGEPCTGNPKPRLWRLPKTESLVVYYGLKNEGADAISRRLEKHAFRIPIGVSVAKTNSPDTCDVEKGIADYVKAMTAFVHVANYLTLNISCPNVYGGEPFTRPELLEQLLAATDGLPITQPIFLKLPADLSLQDFDPLIGVAANHRVHCLIVSNLTKRRDRPEVNQAEVASYTKGGLSGRPVFGASNTLIGHLYKTMRNRFIIIGTGGIFSAEDAYRKIRLGASLVQLATGMIFRGPQLIGQINQGLVRLLQRDGFTSIKEAIGADIH